LPHDGITNSDFLLNGRSPQPFAFPKFHSHALPQDIGAVFYSHRINNPLAHEKNS